MKKVVEVKTGGSFSTMGCGLHGVPDVLEILSPELDPLLAKYDELTHNLAQKLHFFVLDQLFFSLFSQDLLN